MPSATKDQIADVLESIARLLELKGENPFKIRAYTNAVRTLETAVLDEAGLCDPEKLKELDGIGDAIALKIATLASTGKLPFYEELKEQFPPDLFELFELQGLGAKKIKILYEKLDVRSIRKLERACRDGSVAGLAGFGEKTAANILDAIEQRKKFQDQFLFGDIAPLADTILQGLKRHPDVLHAEIAGSFRRRKEIIRDLDFIVSTKNP
ncbi:MAG: helix-hairpin-helix domain-containing protein, partial [Chthoniobacterales bacterium]